MRLHRWLALLPVIHALIGVIAANRVHPFVAGLPFFMAWIISGVILTAVVMALVYRLDPANRGGINADADVDADADADADVDVDVDAHAVEAHR